MNTEKERPVGKIQYEKPAAVDLGPTAPIIGESCVPGDVVSRGLCDVAGNAALFCTRGNSPANTCDLGDVFISP